MDLQRSLLIGAIAVLSFMLLTEWVAFKEDKTAAVTQETSRLINLPSSTCFQCAVHVDLESVLDRDRQLLTLRKEPKAHGDSLSR